MFKVLLGLSALFLASCGAFFSVKGIGLLFSGSFWASIIMASSLEFGKIMATSFLYRYWGKINNIIKAYLLCAIITLMGITSLGIFGFLSQAFYSTKSNIDAIESQISLLENKKNTLNSQIIANNERIKTLIDTRKSQENNLTKALDQSTTTTVTKSGGLFGNDKQETVIDKKSVELKNQTLTAMQGNISNLESNIEKLNINNDNITQEINNIDNEVISLRKQVIASDIGTYKFIAEAFNVEIETVVKWFILVIVAVFDPLAVCLLLAYNIAANKKFNEKEFETIKEVVKEKIIEKPIEIIKNLSVPFKRGTKINHNPDLADPNLKN
jgi:cell division protein FtsL